MKSGKLFIAFIFAFNSTVSYSESLDRPVIQDTTTLRDGVYTGTSRAKYTGEPYWGKVQVTVKKGKISTIDFAIRDSALHEPFNLGYAKHFQGNELYIQQTKNDWNGVQVYPKKAVEVQDTNKIDAISGATWSYNIFKSTLTDALKKARRQISK